MDMLPDSIKVKSKILKLVLQNLSLKLRLQKINSRKMTNLTSFKICVVSSGIFSIYAMTKQKQSCPKCHAWTIFGYRAISKIPVLEIQSESLETWTFLGDEMRYSYEIWTSFSGFPSGSDTIFQSRFPAAWSADATWEGLAFVLLAKYNAAAPATCGLAILVPLIVL